MDAQKETRLHQSHASRVIEHFPNALEKDNEAAKFHLLLSLFVLSIFAGQQLIKAVLRKNYALDVQRFISTLLCTTALGLASLISFSMVHARGETSNNSATPEMHFTSGLIFAISALYVLITGIYYRIKTSTQKFSFSGRSLLQSFLKEDEKILQNFVEPFLFLLIGIAYCFYDYFAGSIIIYCALCVWVTLLIGLTFDYPTVEERLERLNAPNKTNKTNATIIKTDF